MKNLKASKLCTKLGWLVVLFVWVFLVTVCLTRRYPVAQGELKLLQEPAK